MENASKALIIAGSVLIALMIIGALVLMFSNLSAYQETNVQTTREAQIVEFNNQYETYNRKDVRGSELYSLLNKVIDYNRRESEAGTGWSDKGQTVSYEPMTISFTIDRFALCVDTPRLFKQNAYKISSENSLTKNTFENMISEGISAIEKEYGQDSLTNLTTGLTAIFIDADTDQAKQDAVNKFNSVSKKIKISDYGKIGPNGKIREDIYKYYEYVQFKRAHFNCTNTTYNQKTGRILSLEFEFNGKFN